MPGYTFTNLTSAVRDKNSPLRRYLDDRFPNVKPIQRQYREGAGTLMVPGGDANPALLGAAFDYLIRFTLDPKYIPVPAVTAFLGDRAALAQVAGVVRVARRGDRASTERRQAVWALALCTEVYRTGLLRSSPIAALLGKARFTTDALLALAPSGAIRQLGALADLADAKLFPTLRGLSPLALGPTFDASELCSADADLIAGGLLLELKTRLGALNTRTGVRSDRLSRIDLYQLVAYTLFDHSDNHKIREIGLYSARYGYLVRWPANELLDTMAGGPVDYAKERKVVWRILGGPPPGRGHQ